MSDSPAEAETCWTLVQHAARGDREAREAFVRIYLPVVQTYMNARLGASALRGEIDDAIQEVFLDCFRTHGALERVDRDQGSGFRGFLYGVVRNVALRVEAGARFGKTVESVEDREAADSELQDDSPSRLFDRAWARAVMRSAADRLAITARTLGPAAERRVELLRLRFHEALPIREIAERWSVNAAELHHEFARARNEFKEALAAEIRFHLPGSHEEIDRECARVLDLLG